MNGTNNESDALRFRVIERRKWPDICCWQELLTAEWLPLVITPASLNPDQACEIGAKRVFGFDANGRRCYYARRFAIPTLRSDDNDEFYKASAYREQVEAWLLMDDRWLIYKLMHIRGCTFNYGFNLAESCPAG